ncbi:hypothetical protein FRACYDRAFT_248996 [Fragilariopsis cylindrus CCMP1102]|uniref:Uncharacterized protein n=1 Tax=Fragilariopsis cylindrus CCMP1102 TaxID=635003 RepID=A0A1E7ET94_9STRA|nr:hypothetical protein FRACYDRAFT_248996 [Fragilariopsis cylindrus CCMP1102]|eukprot:OEU09092.1 hypothetical protein FRACYDRAFT_248996 [Fragilariopsis cylindrus CCMP1102]
MCAFWAILCLFYCSLARIVGVFKPYAYMEGIWMFKPCLFLNDTTSFEHGNICVLESRISGSFFSKIMFLCASNKIETNSIPQPHEQEIEVVGGKHIILVYYVDVSAPGLFGVVFWNPFN